MMVRVIRVGVLSVCFSAAIAATTLAQTVVEPNCNGKLADEWLLGTWKSGDKTGLDFIRSGDKIVWSFKRSAGVMTERWGEKQPAEGTGEARANGCSVTLRGKYTSYMNSPRGKAVGAPMNYDFKTNGEGAMKGTGFGWGKESYEIGFRKQP